MMGSIVRILHLGAANFYAVKGGVRTLSRLKGAILLIAAALVPLFLVLVLANGLIEGITARFMEIGSFHAQVRTDTVDLEYVRSELSSVTGSYGITAAFPYIEGKGLIGGAEGSRGAAVRAFPADLFIRDQGFSTYLNMESGDFNLTDPDNILLSAGLAQEIGAAVGDTVRLVTVILLPGGRTLPKPGTYSVKGIFSTGYYELDQLTAYIPLSKGIALFGRESNIRIGIKTEDPHGEMPLLTIRKQFPDSWRVYSWRQLEAHRINTFQTTKNTLLFIVLLVIATVSLNILNSMYMLVQDKEREIAVLMCCGVSPKLITRGFLFTGLFAGLIGAVIGVVFGLLVATRVNEILIFIDSLFAAGISIVQSLVYGRVEAVPDRIFDRSYYLDTIPVSLGYIEVLGIMVATTVLSGAASFLPARKAGRSRPLATLRGKL